MPQFRLLPVTICVALLMFMVRANDIWRGFMSGNLGAVAHAQSAPAQPTRQAVPQMAAAQGQQLAAAQQDKPQPAKKDAQPAKPADPGAKPAPEPRKTAPAEGSPEAGAMSSSEIEVLQKLAERREDLDQRGRELDMREGLLKAAEARIDKKIGELKTLQTSIDALIKKHNEQEEAKMASLVRIYEVMKPKEAARIFEQLDMPILLDVIERMNERKVAPILAEMNAAKAKSVTAELAQRRQLPQPSTPNG
jgi:flagellar motility protein MotE (MotC chaperone)